MVSSTTDAPFAQSRETRAAAADTASDAKDGPRAIALWDGLRADFPENARYWHKTGEAYCHAGMLEQADRILDEAIALFPDDEWAAYWSIVVARRKPDWPEALRRAEKMGRAFPDSWRPMVEAAEALAAVQRLVESEEIRREAVKRFPDEFFDSLRCGTAGSRAQRPAGRRPRLDRAGGALSQRAGRRRGAASRARGRPASFAPAFPRAPRRHRWPATKHARLDLRPDRAAAFLGAGGGRVR
jgi:tetratricopeptide (TPR) repeat protein